MHNVSSHTRVDVVFILFFFIILFLLDQIIS